MPSYFGKSCIYHHASSDDDDDDDDGRIDYGVGDMLMLITLDFFSLAPKEADKKNVSGIYKLALWLQ